MNHFCVHSLGGISLCRFWLTFQSLKLTKPFLMSSIESCKKTFCCLKTQIKNHHAIPFHSTEFAYFVQPKSSPAHKIWSRFCIVAMDKFNSDWREEEEEEKWETWKIAFLWLTKCQDMQCFFFIKNFFFHFIFFNTMSLAYLAVTIFGSFVCCWY